MKKSILAVWLFFCAGEILVPYFLGKRIQNYSSLHTVMSAVGAKENGILSILYRSWLIIFGTFTSILFYQLRGMYDYGSYKASIIIVICFALLGCVLCGIFPSEMTKDFSSTSAKIHAVAVVIAFFALMFVPLLLRKIYIINNNRIGNIMSIIAFLISIAIFILQVVSERERFSTTFIGYTGLWQRLYLINLYFYIGMTMINIFPE